MYEAHALLRWDVRAMTAEEKRAVWDVLVETCGAHPQMWDEFQLCFPECTEFRFQGDLGFGGKVWSIRGSVYVSCYPEDRTLEREALINAANLRLSEVTS
jgi:hypothetical protein